MGNTEDDGRSTVSHHRNVSSITSTDGFVVVNGSAFGDEEGTATVRSSESRSSLTHGPSWPDVIPSLWENFIKQSKDRASELALASIYQKGERLGLENTPSPHESYHSEPYVRWTYSELAKGVAILIHALEKRGVRSGSTIFTFAQNCAELPLILWASTFLGCNYVPIHPRNLLNKDEATHIVSLISKSGATQNTLVFAQDVEIARQVLKLDIVSVQDLLTIDDKGDASEFDCLRSLVEISRHEPLVELGAYLESSTRSGIIIFTSGTTALPKGVRVSEPMVNRWMLNRQGSQPINSGYSCFFTLPTNHVYYLLIEMVFRTAGAVTVLPGSSFTPQTIPDLLQLEKCTHFPTSPTMVYALAQVVRERSLKLNTIQSMTCGGSNLGVDVVKSCLEVIGSQSIEVIYGMSETGVLASTCDTDDYNQVVRNDMVFVGKPVYGVAAKICAEDSQETLPINTDGVLHVSTESMCHGYVGGEVPTTFYTDDQGVKWLETGDAAFINEDGMIFISGRVKDVIIRGGVNISPAAIELLLANNPQTARFQTQVVGRDDKLAGEVPIAVIKGPLTKEEAEEMQNYVLKNMGSIYVPEEVLTLESLGLDNFPSTMLGKVQKAKLRRMVGSLPREDEQTVLEQTSDELTGVLISEKDEPVLAPSVEENAQAPTDTRTQEKFESPTDELTQKVKGAWSRILGHDVDLYTPITNFADSIHVMRVRDRFSKDIGVNMTLGDILRSSTVNEQIELIRKQLAQGNQTTTHTEVRSAVHKKRNLLSPKDVVHLRSGPTIFSKVQAHIEKRISTVGLEWADVEAIAPGSDFTSILTQADIINTSWSWKFALLAKEGVTKAGFRAALEALMQNNPILASMYMWNQPAFGSDDAVHVMFNHGPKLYDKVIHDRGSISTKKDFTAEVYKPYEYEMSQLSGLLTNFLLMDVEETGQCGAIMIFHHVHIDGSYLQKLLDDMDHALGGNQLKPHVSYKTWTDSYYSLKGTPIALEQASWHVSRLSDLVSMRESVFPQLPRPHHYTSQAQHLQKVDDNGFHTDFKATGIRNLRQQHGHLSPPTIIKAAWSLLNIQRNKTSTALYSQLQADRRQFPFIPEALVDLVPPDTYSATDVAGNVLQDVINVIHLDAEETVLEFVTRVTRDQEEVNNNAAAPLKRVLADVGPNNSEIMLDIFRSQIFNWTPGLSAHELQNPFSNMQPLSSFIRPSLRLVINVDVGGTDDETVFAQIKSPLFDKAGLRSLARDFEDFVLWICDEKNWNVRMRRFHEALRPATGAEEDLSNIEEKHHII